jgi:hypothetical protein
LNGYGAQVDVTYTPSSAWANNRMPSVEQTVSTVTVRDGRGGIATTTYSYALGAYNFPERRFLGFEQETEFLPCITGETAPACPKIARRYSQDLAAIGELEAETAYNGAGAIIRQQAWVYTVNNGPALPSPRFQTTSSPTAIARRAAARRLPAEPCYNATFMGTSLPSSSAAVRT